MPKPHRMQIAGGLINREHLVGRIGDLGHVGGNDGVGREGLADHLKHPPQHRVQVVVSCLQFALQPHHLVAAFGKRRRRHPAKSGGNRFKRCSGIGQNGQMRHMGAGERGRIDIDADELSRKGERLVPQIGLRDFRARRQHHVGLLHDLARGRVGQRRPGAKRVVRGHRPLGGDSGEDDGAGCLGDAGDGFARWRAPPPTMMAGRWADLSRAMPRRCVVDGLAAGRQGPRRPAVAGRHIQHVDRHLDIARARALAGKPGKGLGHQVAHVTRRVGCGSALGDGRCGALLVDHLVQPAAPLGGVLDIEAAGDHQQRHRVRNRPGRSAS